LEQNADIAVNTDMEGVQTHTISAEVLQLRRKEDMADSLMAAVNNTIMLQQWDETSMLVGLHQVCKSIQTRTFS
jgi:lysophospholipid acyltransferase (LPLAT)-like uncharacterized protein